MVDVILECWWAIAVWRNSPSARANAGLFCPFVSMREELFKKLQIIFCFVAATLAREKIYLTQQTPYLPGEIISIILYLQKLNHLIQPITSHWNTKPKSLE